MAGQSEYSDRDLLVQLIERVDGLIKGHEQDKREFTSMLSRIAALEKKDEQREGKIKAWRTIYAVVGVIFAGLEILILLK